MLTTYTDFDCITDIWFENMEGYQAAAELRRSEAGQDIRDDEKSFVDRSKMVHFLVKEEVTK